MMARIEFRPVQKSVRKQGYGRRGAYRLMFFALLVAVVPALAGCENFDPDNLDVFHLNEKKKLPGERHEVFPGGVPGVVQGVPPEYLKGNQTQTTDNADVLPPASKVNPGDEDANAALKPQAQTVAAEPAEKPKPKAKRKPKPNPQPAQVTIQPSAQGQPANSAQSPWPATPSQAQQQQAQSPWPDPKPSAAGSPWPSAPPPGSFSR